MRLALIILTALSISHTTYAQLKLLRSLTTDTILSGTTDRAGDLYTVTGDGIQKYNSSGDSLHSYNHSNVTSFDTGNSVRFLAYDRSTRRYDILSPSLQQTDSGIIDQSFAIEPYHACSSGNYNLWVLDKADLSLKKISLKDSKVLVDTKLDTSNMTLNQVIFMREYQNLLFILDKESGISIYNILGSYVRTLPVKSITYFNFFGEELYYCKENQITLIDLFTRDERTLQLNPSDRQFVIITDVRLYSMATSRVDIFEFSPDKDLPGKD